MMEHVDNPLELGVPYFSVKAMCNMSTVECFFFVSDQRTTKASVCAAGSKFPGFGEFFLMNSWFGELVLLKTSYETQMNYPKLSY